MKDKAYAQRLGGKSTLRDPFRAVIAFEYRSSQPVFARTTLNLADSVNVRSINKQQNVVRPTIERSRPGFAAIKVVCRVSVHPTRR